MLIVTSLTQPGGIERVTGMSKQLNAHRHKASLTRGKWNGHENEQNGRMLIVVSLTQPGGRERVTRMNKQSNVHRHKANSNSGKRKGHKNEQRIECSSWQAKLNQEEEKGLQEWTKNGMLIVTSVTQSGLRERITRMSKQWNAHRHKPNSTRGKRKSHRNEQTIECSWSQG